MNTLCYIDDTGSIVIGFLIALVISIVIFLIIRGILLWYWKIDVIVKNLEEQTSSLKLLYQKQNRLDARVNYYKFKVLGDNKQAYEYLLYMVLHDLTFPEVKAEERKLMYETIKEKYTPFFQSLGYEFPEYPY